jgi:hypothetical protein
MEIAFLQARQRLYKKKTIPETKLPPIDRKDKKINGSTTSGAQSGLDIVSHTDMVDKQKPIETLLDGAVFDEAESAKSFQEALKLWRKMQ